MDKPKSDRERYGVISGIVGICCNIVLSAAKYIVGGLSGSVSITADAANNLADAEANIVTIIGSILSGKPDDKQHPFGHGRFEYISALVLSFLIFHMGLDLFKEAIRQIISPQPIEYKLLYLLVPIGAIAVKLFMAIYNNRLYKKTGNVNMKAVCQDSINDCIATGATVLALIINRFFGVEWIDGVIGLGVSIFVLLSGYGILRDVLGPLLGQPPKKELVSELEKIMMSEELILGVHDIIVHDYGANRVIASAHAEMPADIDVMSLHDAIDRAEKRIEREMSVAMCIHIDPVRTDDALTERYKAMTETAIKNYNENYSFHDFKCAESDGRVSESFELVIPFEEKRLPDDIAEEIREKLKNENDFLDVFVTVEHSLT